MPAAAKNNKSLSLLKGKNPNIQSQSIKKTGQVDFLNARQSLKSSTVILCGICF